MAQIYCKNCNAEISDTSTFCPMCGQPVEKEECAPEQEKEIVEATEPAEFAETMNEMQDEPQNETAAEGTAYAAPVEETAIQEFTMTQDAQMVVDPASRKKKKIIGISVAAIAVVLIIVAGLVINHNNMLKEYNENMKLAASVMLSGAADAEKAGGLVHDVWYNAIWDKFDSDTYKYTLGAYDFNDALNKLFSDSDFKAQIEQIKSNQRLVLTTMKELNNPPSKYENAYMDLKELYNVYLEFTSLVVDPTGSLTSYTEDFNRLDTDFAKRFEAIQLHFE